MSENRMGETKLREQQERAARSAKAATTCQSPAHVVWKIVGGAALAFAAITLIANLDDIRRYIRISRM
jgi:hypothetical protein